MFISKVVGTTPEKSVLFEDDLGNEYKFDVKPYIFGPWMSELLDHAYFAKAEQYLHESIAWPNGQAISPEDIEARCICVACAV